MYRVRFLLLILLLLSFSLTVNCQSSDTVVLKEGLIIKLTPHDGNRIIAPNAVVASIVTGKWKSPLVNEKVESNGKIIGTWEKLSAGENGWIKDDSMRNAYIYFKYNSEKEDIALLEGMGDSNVFVNGVEHSGNPYRDRDTYNPGGPRFDYSLIPVKLHKGINEFLFECRRGYFKGVIHTGKHGLIFNVKDLTIPDIIVNKGSNMYGAIPVINCTENFYKGLWVKTWSGNSTPAYYPANEINPLSFIKTPFRIKLPAYNKAGQIKLNIEIVEKTNSNEKVLCSSSIELKVVNASDVFRKTFISGIDGSVQYYAVNPPINLKGKPALFLSLHGAGVEALNQAEAYYPKNWGYIVCPTNRRPYGYDWENWGRMDALEVLNIAKKEFNVDTSRIYLTGHSMGGHGVWQLGINYPDQFAAIGPSAGWISYWSYRIKGVTDSTAINKMLVRSTKQSDTYAFTTNLKPDGIYIIQGDADDNVPMVQANSMVANLSKFHKDFIYYVQHGAGHWWDLSDEPGADCVDWAPMFDFFAHHAVAQKEMIRTIDYVTANPAVSSKDYWIQIINQIQQQKLSHIKIRLEAGKREFVGSTNNIETFVIDASILPKGEPVSVLLDNRLIRDIHLPADGKIVLHKENDRWYVINNYSKEDKYPLRCGNIREAFNHNVIFVYGTHGNKEENTWAFNKSRYDAEKIWYRGNSTIETIKDDDFSLAKYKNRSVILFGNSKTNSAWHLLLKNSPVQVDENEIQVGNKEFKGNDLACLMVRPRPDSKYASVGVISGTGIQGMDLVNLTPYFNHYVNLPDIVIYNSGILKSDDQGVKFTGYFGNDWSLKNGEFVIN